MRRPTLLLLFALAGCTHAATVPVNLISRADFAPADREAVWSRALIRLHADGLIARIDGRSEVATVELGTRHTRCRERDCEVTGTMQVVVAPGGELSARYDRTFTGKVGMAWSGGWERLLLEETIAGLQRELNAWVAGVVGSAAGPAEGKAK